MPLPDRPNPCWSPRTTMPKTAKRSASKSDFIRSQPSGLAPAEVVAKAKTEGLKISRALVYMVRGRTGENRGPRKTGSSGSSVTRSITTTSSVENLLKAVAAEIGLGRAVEILEGERARVMSAIGG
jgi:hypothetical protein